MCSGISLQLHSFDTPFFLERFSCRVSVIFSKRDWRSVYAARTCTFYSEALVDGGNGCQRAAREESLLVSLQHSPPRRIIIAYVLYPFCAAAYLHCRSFTSRSCCASFLIFVTKIQLSLLRQESGLKPGLLLMLSMALIRRGRMPKSCLMVVIKGCTWQ